MTIPPFITSSKKFLCEDHTSSNLPCRFSFLLKKFVVFVDIVPSFCQMAENVLQTQIELVINRLKEAIDGADGFQNTHQPQQFELAKFSIDQVVFILEKPHVILGAADGDMNL
ncbi:hypothetical protein HPP92_028625 [Vanilla planifolia]|uniref:Uncharacterized protein n=1 Tax=Vanilla planifolia TaxID=51239 RepID=A0A835U2W8_VANPL|nr:hypothetical protein HPP92_028625 [Vanilla planifolia]